MGRCSIQIVMGPAGSGKSTYCSIMQQHCLTKRQGTANKSSIPNIHVANFDPAAEYFTYDPIFDIRNVISVTEVMEELSLGPNGALLYCMEYVLDHHMEWLHDELDNMHDDDYLFLDCPGQIELYTHIPIQKRIIDTVRNWGYDGHMVSVFCIDATFCCADSYKLLSGNLLSLSTMIALELPHVTLLTKCDLLSKKELNRIVSDEYTSAAYVHQLDQNQQSLLYLHDNVVVTPTVLLNHNDDDDGDDEEHVNNHNHHSNNGDDNEEENIITQEDIDAANEMMMATVTSNGTKSVSTQVHKKNNKNHHHPNSQKATNDNNPNTSHHTKEYIQQLELRRIQRHKLTNALSQIVDDYSMVGYIPLNRNDEDSCDHVLYTISQCIQYGEDHDVYTGDDDNDHDYEPCT